MQGLLDFIKTPEGQGLLSGVFGYAANAQRGAPINSLGRGGLAGLLGYSNALERQDQQAEREFQNKYRQMQMDDMQRKVDLQKAQDAWRQKLPSMLQPKLQGSDEASNIVAQQNAEFGDFGVQKLAEMRQPTGVSYGPDQQALQTYLMDPSSPFADKILERKLLPRDPEYKTVGNSLLRIDGNNVNSVFTEPEKIDYNKPFLPDGTPNKAYQAFKLQDSRAGASSQTVINKQEGAEAKAVGEFFGASYADIQKAGMNASSKINRYDRLGSLLEGVSTGKLTPLGVEVAKTAESLGIKIDPNLPNKEAAQALSSEIALELRNPSGGAGMPGAMSDSDRQFLVSMVPGLSTTPEGRTLMLDTARKLAKRDQEVAAMARQYRQRKGSIDEGFYNDLATWSAQNPLFKPQSVVRVPQGGAPARVGPKFLGFEGN